MSVRALTIVFDSTVGSSTLKSVLTAIADRVDDRTGLCFPSIADTVARTELDRKTVIEKMNLLAAEKILIDTGQRAGRTKQVIVWLFDFQRLIEFSNTQKKQCQKRNGSENGTCTVSPQEESHFSAETVPKTGHGTTTGTVIEPPPPPAGGEGELTKAELDAFAKAAVWHHKTHGGVITNEVGYKHAVRKRIKQSGVTDEDMEILEAYRKARTGSATVPDGKAIPSISPMKPATPEQLAAGDAMLQRVRLRVRGTREQ